MDNFFENVDVLNSKFGQVIKMFILIIIVFKCDFTKV